MKETKVTIYKNIWGEDAYHISLEKIFERIKNGNSKDLIERIKKCETKDEQDKLKINLPSICFSCILNSGKREDARIVSHTGLAILDFDNLGPHEYAEKKRFFSQQNYTVACFLSPRGNGLKVVIRIKDGKKHREHYRALIKEFPGLDAKNINESRVCFESYDPDIFINYEAQGYWDKIAVEEKQIYISQKVGIDLREKFKRLCKWMETKNEFFASGSRNDFVYKLAGACCRFGIDMFETGELIRENYLSQDASFRVDEMQRAIKSAFKKNNFGTAEFQEKDFVDIKTREVIVIDTESEYVSDVIYGRDVIDDALKIYFFGYESAESTGIPQLERLFKWKKGELTILTGIGNHGKSTFLNFLMLNKSVKDGTKWAIFSPENYPAHEYYHDLTETILGAACNPFNHNRPDEATYRSVYDFVSEHFFYVFPKQLAPEPKYIKSRFLELIIKNKVGGCVIDPYNQMSNDYSSVGGRDDKYLESFLADCSMFAITNNIYFVVVAHPHKLRKNESNGYDCPDVYDLAGGAMWNNKADNILVYHRPNRHKDPQDPICEIHTKKIRRQKIVGELGVEQFDYSRSERRFKFDFYPIQKFLQKNQIEPSKRIIRNFSEPQKDETPF